MRRIHYPRVNESGGIAMFDLLPPNPCINPGFAGRMAAEAFAVMREGMKGKVGVG